MYNGQERLWSGVVEIRVGVDVAEDMGEVRDSGDYNGEACSLVDIPVKWGSL